MKLLIMCMQLSGTSSYLFSSAPSFERNYIIIYLSWFSLPLSFAICIPESNPFHLYIELFEVLFWRNNTAKLFDYSTFKTLHSPSTLWNRCSV